MAFQQSREKISVKNLGPESRLVKYQAESFSDAAEEIHLSANPMELNMQYWDWNGPDWKNIDNPDTSAVGFERGPALGAEAGARLDSLIRGLGNRLIILWKGPL